MYTIDKVDIKHSMSGAKLNIEQVVNLESTGRNERTRMQSWARQGQVVIEADKKYQSSGGKQTFSHHFSMYLNVNCAEALVQHLQECIVKAKGQK